MDSQSTINRRGFTKNTLAVSGALAAAPSLTALGANDKIRLGFIGLGGRGQHHFRQFLDFKDVDIVSLCDVDQDNTDACKERLGKPVQVTQHFEDVLDNPDVDAVVIATTDHWHAIPAILAMQAGKDVYCEKPMGHSVEEQQRMIEAVKKTGRVMQ
ncbi:Gfo/Idh/MocA family oxidoreductase, partial [bacterium]|nr:Gfo/Idh/MocA family oxidoreductase [bacterium]